MWNICWLLFASYYHSIFDYYFSSFLQSGFNCNIGRNVRFLLMHTFIYMENIVKTICQIQSEPFWQPIESGCILNPFIGFWEFGCPIKGKYFFMHSWNSFEIFVVKNDLFEYEEHFLAIFFLFFFDWSIFFLIFFYFSLMESFNFSLFPFKWYNFLCSVQNSLFVLISWLMEMVFTVHRSVQFSSVASLHQIQHDDVGYNVFCETFGLGKFLDKIGMDTVCLSCDFRYGASIERIFHIKSIDSINKNLFRVIAFWLTLNKWCIW